ncbi:ABC transporter permease [Acrocarpospora catenulata]|uniref:ABC transporter permease n=1 Tax=Acrocarpospora catenulata TaxID=2836182 RepID=UPI001BDA2521|nr:ABC transporter permease [Acrocarpospora catenulata]
MSIETSTPAASRARTGTGQASAGVIERVPGPAERDAKAYRRRGQLSDNLLRWGTPILVLVLWQLFAMAKILDPQFWPSPGAVAQSLVENVSSGYLIDQLQVSMLRFFAGWGAGALFGLVLGAVLGTFRPARMAIEPLVSAVFTVPKLALFPLMLLLFGLGEMPKIILIALTVFVVVTISTATAIVAIPEGMKEPLRSAHATRWQTFRHLTFPMVLPEIFVSLRITTGMGVLVLVAVEMVQGASGLGYVIWSSWQVYDVERMYVGIITMSLAGVALQYLVMWVGRLVMPWRTAGKRTA